MSDAKWYLLACLDCESPLPIPFSSEAERGKWAGEHTRGTGHDHWRVWDEPRSCMASSPEGHHCALPLGHAEPEHFGGSPMLPEVEWVHWADRSYTPTDIAVRLGEQLRRLGAGEDITASVFLERLALRVEVYGTAHLQFSRRDDGTIDIALLMPDAVMVDHSHTIEMLGPPR